MILFLWIINLLMYIDFSIFLTNFCFFFLGTIERLCNAQYKNGNNSKTWNLDIKIVATYVWQE